MEPETSSDVQAAPRGRIERARLFLSEVRNELKRVTWPSAREVRATTVVVIVTSIVMGCISGALICCSIASCSGSCGGGARSQTREVDLGHVAPPR